jgi:pyruvate kinase
MKNAVLRLTTNHRAVRCGRLQTMLYLEAGQRIIIVAGMPLGTPGATNMVRIAFVGSDVIEAL